MAKKPTATTGQNAQFKTERRIVLIEHLAQTAVKQADDKAAFHDSVKVLLELDQDELTSLLEDMQIDGARILTDLMAQLPDECPVIPLDGCIYDAHRITMGVSTTKLFELEEAEIYRFRIERGAGNKVFKVRFSFKGIPTHENHGALQAMYLDSITSQYHYISIHGALMVDELALEGGGPRVASNVVQMESKA